MFHFVSSKQSLSLSFCDIRLLLFDLCLIWAAGEWYALTHPKVIGHHESIGHFTKTPIYSLRVPCVTVYILLWSWQVTGKIAKSKIHKYEERRFHKLWECVAKTHFYLTGLLLPHILDPVHTSDWWWSDRILLADKTGWKRVRVYFLMDVQSSFPVVVNIQYIWQCYRV